MAICRWWPGVLFGLKAAVLAVVVEALIKVSETGVEIASCLVARCRGLRAIALLKLPFPLIVLGAGGSAFSRSSLRPPAALGRTAADAADGLPAETPGLTGPTLCARRSSGGLSGWAAGAALLLPAGPFLSAMALFFSKTAIVTFGGAYAVLAYVGQQAVELYGWLMPGDMLAGLGLAETTPGPLMLVLVFVGFSAARAIAGLDPLLGGVLGGLLALFFTFAPCFLWIFAGAPHVETAALGALAGGGPGRRSPRPWSA
jgi:chromate transporter